MYERTRAKKLSEVIFFFLSNGLNLSEVSRKKKRHSNPFVGNPTNFHIQKRGVPAAWKGWAQQAFALTEPGHGFHLLERMSLP